MAAALALVMALLPHPPKLPGDPGDKVQHMLAFFTLGVLASAGWRDRPAIAVFAMLATFGGLIEIAQAIPVLHRDAEWGDLLADMGASLIAIGATRMALSRS